MELFRSPAGCTDPDLTRQVLLPVSRLLSQYLALQNVLRRRRRRDGADCDDTTIALCSVLELDAGGTGLISIVAAQRMLRTDTTGTTDFTTVDASSSSSSSSSSIVVVVATDGNDGIVLNLLRRNDDDDDDITQPPLFILARRSMNSFYHWQHPWDSCVVRLNTTSI